MYILTCVERCVHCCIRSHILHTHKLLDSECIWPYRHGGSSAKFSAIVQASAVLSEAITIQQRNKHCGIETLEGTCMR
jgi:hypothetical protein